jgi:hypothetical protein
MAGRSKLVPVAAPPSGRDVICYGLVAPFRRPFEDLSTPLTFTPPNELKSRSAKSLLLQSNNEFHDKLNSDFNAVEGASVSNNVSTKYI